MLINWKCCHCNVDFEFKSRQQIGGHLTNCKENPNRKITIAKMVKSNSLPVVEFERACKRCGKLFIQNRKEDAAPGSGSSPLSYCSSFCSHSRNVSEEQREKTSSTLTERYGNGEIVHHSPKRKEDRACIICGATFQCFTSVKKSTCSRLCKNKNISKILKGSGKVGGYRTKSGTSKFRGAFYKNIWMDSSWELKLATRLDNLNIKWERNESFHFAYSDINGENKKYHPDFYLPDYDFYIEIKGYWTAKVRHKMNDALIKNNFKLLILDKLPLIENFEIKNTIPSFGYFLSPIH